MYTIRIYYVHTRLTRIVCACSIIYTERLACYPQEHNFFRNFKRDRAHSRILKIVTAKYVFLWFALKDWKDNTCTFSGVSILPLRTPIGVFWSSQC